MAVRAVLSRSHAAGGVREMRIERLAAISLGGERLLLRVNPFAVRVLRTHHHCARRPNDGHSIPLHRAIDAEHEDIVPNDLWIVGGVIPICDPFKLVLRYPLIRFHRQVTSETAGPPGRVTDLTIHPRVIVSEICSWRARVRNACA